MDLIERIKAYPKWYHRIALPDGTVTGGWAPLCPERYSIPPDLTGKHVLDIGAWDGYWTWEALKRGAAEVVAIDDFSDDCGAPEKYGRERKWEGFDLCREAFGFTQTYATDTKHPEVVTTWQNERGQRVSRIAMSVYGLSPEYGCRFDVVFFFGTIYHLKHPLLALEKISAVCDGSIYIETACLDEYSPYRGGIGHGFHENEMVMEFYPGAEYGNNPSNWWAPTLQCLGGMLASVGFADIEGWPLTEKPGQVGECRGFMSATKDPLRAPAFHPADVEQQMPPIQLKVAAVQSVPRLGFMDNMTCAAQALTPLHISMISVQGAFWGQCLERGLQQLVDAGIDIAITIDYDTVFTKADVESLLRLVAIHPEATAIVPMQCGRGTFPVLMTIKTRSGQNRTEITGAELQAVETMPIATAHFGLTAFRVTDLLDIPHPWFWDQPNQDGQWGAGRIDADIWFWKQLEKAGKKVLLSCRGVVGHLELMIKWPGDDLRPIYQLPAEFHEKGKPANCWK